MPFAPTSSPLQIPSPVCRILTLIPICEVLYALNYIKKVLWNHILSSGYLDSARGWNLFQNLIVSQHPIDNYFPGWYYFF